MTHYLHHPCVLPAYDFIVFCHVRWDFLFQRPQHIINRLAEDFKVLVVEKPVDIYSADRAHINILEIHENLHICKPLIKEFDELGPYLKAHLTQETHPVGWFYCPAFVSVLDSLEFNLVVYDCMDELSMIKDISQEKLDKENELFAASDIVFTEGKSLFATKALKHPNVFCFPSAVDVQHFSDTDRDFADPPEDLQHIGLPIVGYCGVIDERIDFDLVTEVAARMPDFDFVLIGPLANIEMSDLPEAPNIHYLGKKSYRELPEYMRFFEFAMVPVALNENTQHISPTEILEYMAAGKPIISTGIRDVIRDYSSCVSIVRDADEFCDALKNPVTGFETAYREILGETSWERTVQDMCRLLTVV